MGDGLIHTSTVWKTRSPTMGECMVEGVRELVVGRIRVETLIRRLQV